MRKLVLLLTTNLFLSPLAIASSWTYGSEFDDITQVKEYYAIAESDSATDLSGRKVNDEAALAFFRSGNTNLVMVALDQGTLDICVDRCSMPIRIDDKSYYAYLSGNGGEANAIVSIVRSDTYETYPAYEFLYKELASAKKVSFRVSKFIGDTTNYYFTFKKPFEASRFNKN